uniref:Putative RecA n=1 Tax=viral metagenome TaxID=1070528 RepID=A0A6M3XWL4_9ZZZZ
MARMPSAKKPTPRKPSSSDLAKQVEEQSSKPIERKEPMIPIDKGVISTGSTLLDLAISGRRVRGGGVPGGMIMIYFGPSSSGKTILLCELMANAKAKIVKDTGAGAEEIIKIGPRAQDPETRMDKGFVRHIFRVDLEEGENYLQPATVLDAFKNIWDWKPDPSNLNVYATDSIAALTTESELDRVGQLGRQAAELSQELRMVKNHLQEYNILMACTNQERANMMQGRGPATKQAGGFAIGFWSSLNIRIKPDPGGKYIKTKVKSKQGKEEERIIGVKSLCRVEKSSVDVPYREAPVIIMFDYGVDDVRANLLWLNDKGVFDEQGPRGGWVKKKGYVVGGKRYLSIDAAVETVESQELQEEIKDQVIDTWEFLDQQTITERSPKQR